MQASKTGLEASQKSHRVLLWSEKMFYDNGSAHMGSLLANSILLLFLNKISHTFFNRNNRYIVYEEGYNFIPRLLKPVKSWRKSRHPSELMSNLICLSITIFKPRNRKTAAAAAPTDRPTLFIVSMTSRLWS